MQLPSWDRMWPQPWQPPSASLKAMFMELWVNQVLTTPPPPVPTPTHAPVHYSLAACHVTVDEKVKLPRAPSALCEAMASTNPSVSFVVPLDRYCHSPRCHSLAVCQLLWAIQSVRKYRHTYICIVIYVPKIYMSPGCHPRPQSFVSSVSLCTAPPPNALPPVVVD